MKIVSKRKVLFFFSFLVLIINAKAQSFKTAEQAIELAIKNKPVNDYQKLKTYQYRSYNKFTMQKGKPLKELGFPNNLIDGNEIKKSKYDVSIDSFYNSQYIFLSETIADKYMKNAVQSEEVVRAIKMSGLKKASLSLIAINFQIVSFYDDYLRISKVDYLGPLSKNALKTYDYELVETKIHNNDTTYKINFKPKEGKFFEGLKGRVNINSDGYAIESIIAQAAEIPRIRFKIEQRFNRKNRHWFPTFYSSEVDFNGVVEVKGFNVIGVLNVSYNEVSVNDSIVKVKFDDAPIRISDSAEVKAEVLINDYRKLPLTIKEEKTYVGNDFLGIKKRASNRISYLEIIRTGFIPLGLFKTNITQIINYNAFEKFRPMVNLYTSENLSKRFTTGGYFGYSFGDKKLKYGAMAETYLNKKNEIKLKAELVNDIIESGNVKFFNDKRTITDVTRHFVFTNMDYNKKLEFSATVRPFNYMLTTFFVNETRRESNTTYSFLKNGEPINKYTFKEVGASFRYAFGERYLKKGSDKIIFSAPYPIVFFKITNGYQDFEYLKLDIKIKNYVQIYGLGRTDFELTAGNINNPVPYSISYNGKGNILAGNLFRIGGANVFETMGRNEFLSSQYAALFINHKFNRLLFKSKKFSPALSLITNLGIGKLQAKQLHLNYPIKTLEKGYLESGIYAEETIRLKNNLLRGFGIAFYHRYGPNRNPELIDNFFAKFTITLGI